MTNNNNTVNNINADNGVLSTAPTTTPITPAAGQLWRDRRKDANHRLILVLDIDGVNRRAVCQSLATGKINRLLLDHFNRGTTGYIYAATLFDLVGKYNDYVGARNLASQQAPSLIRLIETYNDEIRALAQILKLGADKMTAALQAAKDQPNSR